MDDWRSDVYWESKEAKSLVEKLKGLVGAKKDGGKVEG